MPENDFKVWAAAATTEIYDQTEYEALPQLGPGVAPGIADAKQANKAWRQGTLMAAMVANYIVDQMGVDAIDDGTTTAILANFKRAVRYSQKAWNATGTANVQAVSLTPSPTSYTELIGVPLNIKSIATNGTGGVTLNINGLGAKAVTYSNGSALIPNALILNSYYTVLYDGTKFQIENTLGFTPVQQGGGTGQGTNKVYMGYHTATNRVNVQIDSTNYGDLPFLGQTNDWTNVNRFYNVVPGAFQLSGNDTSGANIQLSSPTSSKYIRVLDSVLQVINSAYTGPIFELNDVGDLNYIRNLTTGGPIYAYAGDITAASGKLRAGLQSGGDSGAATLLGEFMVGYNPGYGWYARIPGGITIMGGTAISTTGDDIHYFPTAFLSEVWTVVGVDDGYGLGDIGIANLNTSQFEIFCGWNNGFGGPTTWAGAGLGVNWIAIGR